MAWTKEVIKQADGSERVAYSETVTLPSSATTEFSSEFDFAAPDLTSETRFIIIEAVVSAVSGTNVDLHFDGVTKSGGNKARLTEDVIAARTDTTIGIARVDLNSTSGFASAFYMAHETDANESANTITYRIWTS